MFSHVRIAHVLHFISICDLFTDSPYYINRMKLKLLTTGTCVKNPKYYQASIYVKYNNCNRLTMNDKRNAYKILVGNQKERDYKEDLQVGGRVVLRWILHTYIHI
jgi:hypothetical protein